MPAPPGEAAPHYSRLFCVHVSPAAAPAATVSSLTHFTAAAQFQTSQPAMSTATTPAAEVRHGGATSACCRISWALKGCCWLSFSFRNYSYSDVWLDFRVIINTEHLPSPCLALSFKPAMPGRLLSGPLYSPMRNQYIRSQSFVTAAMF